MARRGGLKFKAPDLRKAWRGWSNQYAKSLTKFKKTTKKNLYHAAKTGFVLVFFALIAHHLWQGFKPGSGRSAGKVKKQSAVFQKASKPSAPSKTPSVYDLSGGTMSPDAEKESTVRIQPSPARTGTAPVLLPPLHKMRPMTGGPQIVFVIDDIGHRREGEEDLTALRDLVTYAILPNLKYSAYFAKLARKTGAEVILHQPLETVDGTVPGPGLITGRMSAYQITEMLHRNLETVPGALGINNHMGSLGTADPFVMDILLSELKFKGMLFLDSFTTPKSLGSRIASELRMPVLKRDVFLDNIDSKNEIRSEIEKLARAARKKSFAIGIGHYRANTLQVIREEIPRLEEAGFQIASLAILAQSSREVVR